MKLIAGIWFTFGGDAACLAISVASFRAAGGGPVCIFDEAANPLTPEQLEAIAPDFYQQTPPRGGNLNGWDTCKLMLQACKDVEEAFPNIVGHIKIDSDTLILTLRWVLLNFSLVGWDCGLGCYGVGMARYMGRGLSGLALDNMNTRLRFGKAPEDQAIWATAIYVNEGLSILHTGRPSESSKYRAGAYQYSDLDAHLPAPAEEYDVITFGNRYQLTIPEADRRKYAATVMERVWKNVLASKAKT